MYFVGILNSRLLWKWFQHNAKRRGIALEINGGVLSRAPIKRIDFANATERGLHDKIAKLATILHGIRSSLTEDPSEGAKRTLHREFESLDTEVDRLVYDLYGLSENEISDLEQLAIPEENTDKVESRNDRRGVLEFPAG